MDPHLFLYWGFFEEPPEGSIEEHRKMDRVAAVVVGHSRVHVPHIDAGVPTMLSGPDDAQVKIAATTNMSCRGGPALWPQALSGGSPSGPNT